MSETYGAYDMEMKKLQFQLELKKLERQERLEREERQKRQEKLEREEKQRQERMEEKEMTTKAGGRGKGKIRNNGRKGMTTMAAERETGIVA